MKQKFIAFAILAIALIAWHTAAHAQWVQTNAPIGMDIRSLGVNGTTLFAGANDNDAVYRSTNNGIYWTWASKGLPITLQNSPVSAFAEIGATVFAGLGDLGVYRSSDNGDTWIAANGGLNNTNVKALIIMGATLFADIYNGGVYRSTDNGNSWIQVDNGLTDSNVQAFAVIGTTLFAAADSSVFRSTNNGSTWVQASNGIAGYYLFNLTANGTTLFAGTNGYGEFRSTDSGATWTPVDSGLTQSEYLASIVAINSTLYAASSYGNIYRSTNNGSTWEQLATLYNNNSVTLSAIGSTLFAGVVGPAPLVGGVFRSTDGGSTWADANAGISNIAIENFIASGNTLFAGMSYNYGYNHGGLYNSTDNGDTWGGVFTQSGFPDAYYSTLAATGTFMFAGGNEFVTPQWSTDGGRTWDSSTLGGISDLAIAGNFLYAANHNIYRSADSGKTWAQVNYGLADTNVYHLAAIGTTLIAGTFGSGLYRSTVGGGIWSPVNNGITDTANIYALAVIGSTFFAGTDSGAYRSKDTGSTWTNVNSGLLNGAVYSFAVYGTTLFAIAGTSVFSSTNGGDSWTPMNNGLTDLTIYKLARTGTTLFAAANTAIYRYDLSGANAVVEPLPVPSTMSLSQNYPNPASPSTNIDYTLAQSGFVSLKIYNALGKEVATLVNSEVSAGAHTAQWQPQGLPDGVYFYRLSYNNQIQTRRLLLVR